VRGRAIRVLNLEGGPSDRGAAHGAAYHNEIRRYTAERIRLAADGSWAGRETTTGDVMALAQAMLPAHREYAPDLVEEMEAMAAAAGITTAEAVVVGGFTDFVDAVRAEGARPLIEEDDCTAVMVPPAAAAGGAPLFGQTWDMHDSATEHVTMMRVRPETGPSALLFTTVGCLGQIGLSSRGLVVGINNLTAADGRPGVTWPFVVRKALQQDNLEAALGCVLDADLAGGHNYLLMDGNGAGYNIEAMPGHRAVTPLGEEPLVHTNHCLDEQARKLEAPRPADLQASSEARLAKAIEMVSRRPVGVDDLVAMTREPEAICRRSEPPHHNESSGAVIIGPAGGDFWACWGVPADNDYEYFRL
jgi:isopenicillin-N N-acyltransferase-like protein